MGLHHAFPLSSVIKAGAIAFVGAYLYISARNKKKNLSMHDEPGLDSTAIDYEALEAAERLARMTIEEQRASLGSDFELWARLPTQTLNQARLNEWVEELEKEDVEIRVLFEAAMSPKGGKTMRAEGFYEIYVKTCDLMRVNELEQRLKIKE